LGQGTVDYIPGLILFLDSQFRRYIDHGPESVCAQDNSKSYRQIWSEL